MPAKEFACDENRERGEEREHVSGKLVAGDAQEKEAPEDGVEVGLLFVVDFSEAEEGWGPGHSKADEDGDVEPEGLHVLEFRGEEALEVVPDDEFVDEALAVDGVAGEIPGECGGEHAGPVTPFFAIEEGNRDAQDKGDQAFGEYGEAEGEAGGPGFVAEDQDEEGVEADGEWEVCYGDLREGEPADGGAEDEGALKCWEREEEAEAEQSYGQAGGQIGREAEGVEDCDEPVEKRGFLEPRLAPEGGSDPVS